MSFDWCFPSNPSCYTWDIETWCNDEAKPYGETPCNPCSAASGCAI